MQGFEKVAPFLTHPLVLIGFVVLLFFGMVRALLKANIIQPLPRSTGGRIVFAFLRYGFVIALVVILLGFALEAYRVSQRANEAQELVQGVEGVISRIDDVEVSYEMMMPLSHPIVANYLSRLKGEAQRVVDDF